MTKRSDQDYHLARECSENAAAEAARDPEVQALHRNLAARHADRAHGRIVLEESWAAGPTRSLMQVAGPGARFVDG